jgi:hypothetical protein
MAAAGARRQRCTPGTKSGVQVDSSVAHQFGGKYPPRNRPFPGILAHELIHDLAE